ncbi:uncharacterized protein (TIGR02444 family) [Alkalispirillum mobile]|uniref:Uncharacterized protein (TIGR02444 family) n=1 Tax=Alkalispirillum mobile TaxID=85925 RepID=A0A498BSR2_9GAMM|nr:TIGR02444 family protein [Alkalispirillum mobile]RLK47024.1 uncharacterized protein (TIGR02444 family) [Alkalispirillum mobile]
MSQADDLWEFSIRFYRQPGVEPACLRLQARYGLSVSLLLAAMWFGREGWGRLGATEMEAAIRRAQEWDREVIEPLRALRRHLKKHPPRGLEESTEALRRDLLGRELEAERIEQRLFLADYPQGMPVDAVRWQDAVVNAALVVRRKCPRLDEHARETLCEIFAEAFPEVSRDEFVAPMRLVWPDNGALAG